MTKKKDLGELITNNKENAEELSAADKKVASEKDKIEKNISKLIFTNEQNAEELSAAYKIIATQKKEIKKQAADLILANKEKEKSKADLVISKKELAHKAKLIILNKKLALANKQEKLAKEKAEESDSLKSAFLANMSHEIRTPMNGILGFAELLKEPNLAYEEQQEFIRIIGQSGSRMLNTINNIVDISKIESGLINVDIKESNINEQIEFIYKFFKPEVESKGLQFFFKNGLQLKEAVIKTDIEKIYAILTSLIKNAIKFTDEGSIEFGYEKKGKYLEFFVKDTGMGINQSQKEIIFERFRQGSESLTRKYEGSGLGLSISKSYVEMLDGKLWVESEERKGSIFYFTIPYNAVSEEKTASGYADSEKYKEVQLKNLKILVELLYTFQNQ